MEHAAKISRRAALAASAVLAPCVAAADPRADAEAALRAFLHAFENCDLPAMEAAFAPDATGFDRVIASSKGSPAPLDLAALRRRPGMPAGMRAVAVDLPKRGGSPPYQTLDPKDLLVQVAGDMALCTFDLESPTGVGRRTIVLVRRSGMWKTLHVHASNAVT
jgi:ketosteroid isomerase-like protein